jgi:hypothetical protein
MEYLVNKALNMPLTGFLSFLANKVYFASRLFESAHHLAICLERNTRLGGGAADLLLHVSPRHKRKPRTRTAFLRVTMAIRARSVADVKNRKLCVALDRLCGLVVRVPGYRAEMHCVSCEVRTEFIYVK